MFLAHAYYHRSVRAKVVQEIRDTLPAALAKALDGTSATWSASTMNVKTFPVETTRDQMHGSAITIVIWGSLPPDVDREKFRSGLYTVCCQVVPCPLYGSIQFIPGEVIGPVQIGDLG